LAEIVALDGAATPAGPPATDPAAAARPTGPAPGAALAAQIAQAVPLPAGTGPRAGLSEIVLAPAELGRVGIRFEIEQGQPVLHLSVERAETLELMRRNLDQLEAALRDLGHSGCSVSLGGRERGDPAPAPRESGPAGSQMPEPDSPAPRIAASPGRLDLRL
jgi:hypothetical protein